MLRPINKSAGTTETERYLTKLAEKTFLGLWSFANVFTPEGRKNGKGHGTELCDLLVICGDDVLIFSDKDIKYPSHPDPIICWKRWKSKSIDKSVSQLRGAEKWMRERPQDLFLDAECAQRFPFAVPSNPRLHLIAVTNNSFDPAKKFFGRDSSGSFVCVPALSTPEVEAMPFFINDVDPSRTFVHIFDEFALDVVLDELDTIFDLVGYLTAKEEAIRMGRLAQYAGEEDLLAYYVVQGGLQFQQITFPHGTAPEAFGGFLVSEGMWAEYVNEGIREAIRRNNDESYFWDFLIQHFASHILNGSAVSYSDVEAAVHEGAIRFLAMEGRLARRQLAHVFLDKVRTVPSDRRSARLAPSPTSAEALYVFVLFPRDKGQDYAEYRQERYGLMQAYAIVAKRKHPTFSKFIIIATEPDGSEGRSEDCLAVEIDELTPEAYEESIRLETEDRVLSDVSNVRISGSLVTPTKISVGRKSKCPCGSGKKAKRCCYR